ncbi:MAG: HD domain-containing protein [Gemmatimonadota bacterium]
MNDAETTSRAPHAPALAALLPGSGAEGLRAALGEVDASLRLLAPGERPDPATGLVVVHAAAPGARELLGPGAPPALLLLDPETPGAPGPGDAALHLSLPCSADVLVAACRGLLARAGGRSGTSVRARVRGPARGDAAGLYAGARAAAEAVLAAARDGRAPELEETRVAAERIHTALIHDNALVNRSLEPHPATDLASHSVNVAVIAGRIAMGMALPSEDVIRSVQAGLVHDLGMALLPARLLENPGRWSEEDRAELRRHPELGAALLEPHLPRHDWLRRAVLQEHERRHGQGYPIGLSGTAIDPLARTLAVADVFEALSHPRTYRSPNTALEALEQITGMAGEWFDPGVVAALVNEISAFPLDSWVQLSTGGIGRVVETDPENLFRPVVELAWDADWRPLDPPRRLDLGSVPDVTVSRSLLESELPLT